MITMSNAMFRSSFRRRIIGLLLIGWVVAGLAACGTLRLGYNQAATFSYWWLDGYLDFSESQSTRVREHLNAFFAWHRAIQVPDYAVWVGRVRADVQNNTTPAQVCQRVAEVGTRVDTSLNRMLPALADVGRGLAPPQLQHLAQKFNKVNADFSDDFLQADRARRHKVSIKRATDRAEFLYGSLSRPQHQMIVDGIKASPFDPELWLAERKQRQQDILQALKAMPAQDAAEATRTMGTLVTHFRHSPRPAYEAYEQRLLQYNCALAAQFHNTTTPEQRQEAVARLKRWEDDLLLLSPPAQGRTEGAAAR
jgi:hypothetical protein